MSHEPIGLPETTLGFLFEAQQPLPAGIIARFLIELDAIIKDDEHFGEGAILEVLNAGRGTFWMELQVWLSMGSDLAGMLAFPISLAALLKSSDHPLAMVAATLVVEHGVKEFKIGCGTTCIAVQPSEMPSVKNLHADNLIEDAARHLDRGPLFGRFIRDHAGRIRFDDPYHKQPFVVLRNNLTEFDIPFGARVAIDATATYLNDGLERAYFVDKMRVPANDQPAEITVHGIIEDSASSEGPTLKTPYGHVLKLSGYTADGDIVCSGSFVQATGM